MRAKTICALWGWIVFFKVQSCLGATMFENDLMNVSLDTYLRTDLVSFKNVLSLDSAHKDDSTTYLGVDYSLGFTTRLKEPDTKFFLKLERNGPYDYDAPVWIHKQLIVSGPRSVEAYRNEELLPQAEEFWLDTPVGGAPVRFKAGLFPYEVGMGFAQGTGSFENYGVSLHHESDSLNWRLLYLRPDLVYKTRLGPRIPQEAQEGIAYEPNAANYIACDASYTAKNYSVLPFVSVLLDNTSSGKRTNTFSTPVHKEILGILGMDYALKIKDFSFGMEVARNFGGAKSLDPDAKDITHEGYLAYLDTSYTQGPWSPHGRFLFSSGNKVTTDMVDNGDTQFPGSTNKAFSSYSPLNTNLFDSLSPTPSSIPLVFFGWGNGLNYGVGLNRPSTLADDAVLENLIMPSFGVEYKFSETLSAAVDWWYILANQRGVGTFEGEAIELSRNLGQEVDVSINYDMNKHVSLSLCTGYFIPGSYFKEKRDDDTGSLLTPFVRGDGEADPAYQIEASVEFKF